MKIFNVTPHRAEQIVSSLPSHHLGLEYAVFAPITKPTEISTRVRTEVNAILAELANYKYDPDAYRKSDAVQ